MDRKVGFALGYALGFFGVFALATGWYTPAASHVGPEPRTNTALIVPGTGGPRWIVVESAAPSRLYVINTGLYEDTSAAIPSDSTFGELMPDGTRCAINCWDNE